MSRRKIIFQAIAGLAVLLSGCGEKNSFRVDGVVDGADKASLVVERADYNGVWQPVDSVKTSADGSFSMKVAAAGAPEIYRLVLDGKYIYFPVDSTENIHIETTLKGFGSDYSVGGSSQAALFEKFDKSLMRVNIENEDSLDAFKKRVFNAYIKDGRGNLLSYYVLTKSIGNRLLFNPEDTRDVKYYSAVATIYKNFNPEDPRAAVLERMAIEGLKKRNRELGKKVVVNANEVKIIEIALPGTDGSTKRLSEVLVSGHPGIVVFTGNADKNTPAINLRLRELYDRRGGNLSIYQIGVDGDRYDWKNGASNLPWTSVYASSASDGKVFRDYNVGVVPAFFIYSSAGELTKRVDDISELEAAL